MGRQKPSCHGEFLHKVSVDNDGHGGVARIFMHFPSVFKDYQSIPYQEWHLWTHKQQCIQRLPVNPLSGVVFVDTRSTVYPPWLQHDCTCSNTATALTFWTAGSWEYSGQISSLGVPSSCSLKEEEEDHWHGQRHCMTSLN